MSKLSKLFRNIFIVVLFVEVCISCPQLIVQADMPREHVVTSVTRNNKSVGASATHVMRNNKSVGASAGLSSEPIAASIAWDHLMNQEADLQYGLNAYNGGNPDVLDQGLYRNNVAAMRANIVRWHSYDQMSDSTQNSRGWIIDPAKPSYRWDEQKITRAMREAFSAGGAFAYNPVKMINIVNWPWYLDDGEGHLKRDKYDEYAQFCADLVRIINIDGKFGFQYFEVFNELETPGYPYEKNMGEVGRMYNKAAAAMKAVDPTIKVGGPSFKFAWATFNLDDFFAVAAPSLDFVSFHHYGTNSAKITNQELWDRTNFGDLTKRVREEFRKYSSRSIEYFHDEYNVNWYPSDVKMTRITGAIFDALVVVSLITSNTKGGMAWNETDDEKKNNCDYGKLDCAYNRRPSSYLFQYLNEDMIGDTVESGTQDSSKIVTLAVRNNKKRSFMLINRSEADQKVQLYLRGLSSTVNDATQVNVKEVYNDGGTVFTSSVGALSDGNYVLPADTIMIFSLPDVG